MTTIRKIVTSQVDGNSANSDINDEIRPFGEASFYIDTSGDTDKLVLSMFEGQRTHLRSKVLSPGIFYGSNADSGDGAGLDTIKLIPDTSLHYNDGNYGNDQYLIVDPTAPNHIHIRAGGTIDNSSADLFIGGEKNFVRVSDNSDDVLISTDDNNDGTKSWTFNSNGDLYVPNYIIFRDGTLIGDEGGATPPVFRIDAPLGFGINFTTDSDIEGASNVWSLGIDGSLTFPDGTVQTTAYVLNPGEPLFVVINSDGNNAWSNDGTTWTEGTYLPTDGYQYERVAVANSYIVYIQGFEGPGNLAYATTYGTTPTEVTFNTTGTENYQWSDIQSNGNYTVAVGAFNGDNGEGGNTPSIPVWAYTTNGSTWTIGGTDPVFQEFTAGGKFASVDYGANGWFFVAESGGPSGAGGFFITSLTSELTMTNYIPFGDSLPDNYYPNISSVVWDGLRWWVRDSNDATYYVSSGANPLTSTWTSVSLDTQAIDQGFGETGNSFYEDAGGLINGVGWFAVASTDGKVLASNDGGETWYGSVPLPYTSTLSAATSGSPCVVTFNGNTPNGNGELIVISNAVPSDYNGSYFVKNVEGAYELYTDVELTTPLDSTFFGALVSADVTLNHGQYIDSLGFGLEKFIVGNDDDQLFTSTDLSTWTKVDDQSEQGFAYWNDISFNATWGASNLSIETDRLINNSATLLLGSDGNVTFPNDLNLLNFNTESLIFKSGDTFGIAGDTTVFLQWQDYVPGQGPGKQSIVQAYDGGVTLYVSDPGDDTTYVWEFTNDGTTYLAKNSTSPVSYLQTPNNDNTIGLYLAAGNGVTISANDYTESVRWEFDTNGGFTTPYGLEIADQYIQHPDTGNFISLNNDTGIDVICDGELRLGTNFSDTGNRKFWKLNPNGTVTFPDSTIQSTAYTGGRIVEEPTSSAGATGDQVGDLAFSSGYIYYCTENFGGTTYEVLHAISESSANGVDNGYLVTNNYQLPEIGWKVYYNGETSTINQVNNGGVPGFYVVFVDVPLVIPGQALFEWGPAPSANIWKRVAWSNDTW